MPAIAIVLHQLTATGVARNALAIGHHMRQAGWHVTLITMRGGGELAGQAQGLDYRVLGGPKLLRKLEMRLAVAPLRRELTAIGCQVVLSAGNHAHQAVLSAVNGIAASRRPAAVCRISNDLTHNASWRNPLAFVSLRRVKARRVVRDAKRLVLVSPHLASDPLLQAVVTSGKARIIPNGVDRAAVRTLAEQPCPHPWAAEDVPIVLAVGRIAPQKNFARLLRAFAQVRAVRESRLIIVGGGKARAKTRLEGLATDLGLSEHVALVGRTDNPFPYFHAASVLALPSLYEGSPNVLLEALACGLPAVASSLAGSADEVLDDGRYGLVVDPYDTGAFAQALLAQLDPATCIGPETRVDAYDLASTMGRYQALFEELA